MLNMQTYDHIGESKVSLYVLGPLDTEFAVRKLFMPFGNIDIYFRDGRC